MDKASVKKLGAMIERAPSLLGMRADKLQQTANWVISTGVKTRLIGHIFEQQPEILTIGWLFFPSRLLADILYCMADTAIPELVTDWLKARNIPDKGIARILEVNPKTFSSPPEEMLEPSVEWLIKLGNKPLFACCTAVSSLSSLISNVRFQA
jgi:hypothetical protein